MNINNFNKNKKIVFIISVLIVILIIIYYIYYRKSGKEQIETINNELIPYKEENKIEDNKIEEYNKITIHISGSVNKEGVYELPQNSRIVDAIEIAGGLKDDAEIAKINLAYILQDGMKIYIPNINDKDNESEKIDNTQNFIMSDSGTLESTTKNSKININKATQTELETLPGIGPSIAIKIINYRNEKGKFTNIEEIKNVGGIGNSKFDQIKEFICV